MTSYSPSYTSRYRAKYRACGIEHSIQLRKALGASFATTDLLAGTVHDLFNAFAAQMPVDLEFISGEVAEEGSDIFVPGTTPAAVTGLVAVADYTPFQKVTHTRFAGKAPGSRASCELYGIWWEYSNIASDANTIPYDGLATAAEWGVIGTAVALLNTQAFANSGQATVWYNRATVKVNDFWLRQVRSGGIT